MIVLSIGFGPEEPKPTVHCRITRTKGGAYGLKVGGAFREKDDVLSLLRDIQKDHGLSQGVTEGSPYAAVFSGAKEEGALGNYEGELGTDTISVLKIGGTSGGGLLDSNKKKKKEKKEKKDKKKEGKEPKKEKKKEHKEKKEKKDSHSGYTFGL